MTNINGISEKEYQMIREEIVDNIKKQDEIGNTIFVVLGLSIVFNNWIENVMFLVVVLLFSSVLLSKIIHCRNTVYYLSSYLLTDEALECCQWERKIVLFKKTAYRGDKNNGFIRFMFHCAFVMRNLGNLIFCFFVFAQITSITYQPDNITWINYTLFSVAILALALNIVFTVVICIDRKVKDQYKGVWDQILK